MKVLLINPPWYRLLGGNFPDIPLGLCYLASALRNEVDVGIYNADFDKDAVSSVSASELTEGYDEYKRVLKDLTSPIWSEVRQKIASYSPDVIGITIMTAKYASALNVAKIAKELNKNVKVVVGGVHPTVCPQDTVQEKFFDYVIRGEGEITFQELYRTLKNRGDLDNIAGLTYTMGSKIITNPARELIKDIDNLSIPARDCVIDKGIMPASAFGKIISSRGCPFDCTFCSSRKIWGRKVRFRTVESVISEIEEVQQKFGTAYFDFEDDTLTLNKKWLLKFCQRLLEKGLKIEWSCNARVDTTDEETIKCMKMAGCSTVNFGVESGDQQILDFSNKRINLDQVRHAISIAKKHRLRVKTFFMIGLPRETKESIKQTLSFIKEIQPDFVVFSVATAFPGSDLHEYSKKHNLLPKSLGWSDYYAQSKYMGATSKIEQKEFAQIVRGVERKIDRYNSRRLLMRLLKQPQLINKEISISSKNTVAWIGKGFKMIRKAL